jgi:hypothetical protein
VELYYCVCLQPCDVCKEKNVLVKSLLLCHRVAIRNLVVLSCDEMLFGSGEIKE